MRRHRVIGPGCMVTESDIRFCYIKGKTAGGGGDDKDFDDPAIVNK